LPSAINFASSAAWAGDKITAAAKPMTHNDWVRFVLFMRGADGIRLRLDVQQIFEKSDRDSTAKPLFRNQPGSSCFRSDSICWRSSVAR
jgi:hypothetical protein